MSEIDEVFRALLFGEGFWLGFLIITSVCLLVANRIKYSGSIFVMVLIFLGLEYSENLVSSSNKMWGIVLCFIGVIFLCIQLYVDAKS